MALARAASTNGHNDSPSSSGRPGVTPSGFTALRPANCPAAGQQPASVGQRGWRGGPRAGRPTPAARWQTSGPVFSIQHTYTIHKGYYASTLVVQWSEQPRGMHEIMGSNSRIIHNFANRFYLEILVYLAINSVYRGIYKGYTRMYRIYSDIVYKTLYIAWYTWYIVIYTRYIVVLKGFFQCYGITLGQSVQLSAETGNLQYTEYIEWCTFRQILCSCVWGIYSYIPH
jgi:hypothetical protein